MMNGFEDEQIEMMVAAQEADDYRPDGDEGEMGEKVAAIVKFDERRADGYYPLILGECVTYYLDPPLESVSTDRDTDEETVNSHTYVWVSQAAPLGDWETYIFASNEDGEVTDWGELDGSRKGYVTPDDLMRELGYKVIGRP
jgi:hypothetical protein